MPPLRPEPSTSYYLSRLVLAVLIYGHYFYYCFSDADPFIVINVLKVIMDILTCGHSYQIKVCSSYEKLNVLPYLLTKYTKAKTVLK